MMATYHHKVEKQMVKVPLNEFAKALRMLKSKVASISHRLTAQQNSLMGSCDPTRVVPKRHPSLCNSHNDAALSCKQRSLCSFRPQVKLKQELSKSHPHKCFLDPGDASKSDIMHTTQILDHVLDEAEVLFDPSKSVPLCVQSANIRCDKELHRFFDEVNGLKSSNSQVAGNIEKLQKSSGIFSEHRSKRQRSVSFEQEVHFDMQFADGIDANISYCVSGEAWSALEDNKLLNYTLKEQL